MLLPGSYTSRVAKDDNPSDNSVSGTISITDYIYARDADSNFGQGGGLDDPNDPQTGKLT